MLHSCVNDDMLQFSVWFVFHIQWMYISNNTFILMVIHINGNTWFGTICNSSYWWTIHDMYYVASVVSGCNTNVLTVVSRVILTFAVYDCCGSLLVQSCLLYIHTCAYIHIYTHYYMRTTMLLHLHMYTRTLHLDEQLIAIIIIIIITSITVISIYRPPAPPFSADRPC